MQNLNTLFRLAASAFITLCLSVTPTTQAPLITSGMDAVVGQAGWYTSNVIIHTATFTDPQILAPAADIRVEREGQNEVLIPDGLGGTATQLVNIDKSAPSVSIANLYQRGDGAIILSVTVFDQVSGPSILQISLDNGKTWHTYSVDRAYSAPEYIWNLAVDQKSLNKNILARAIDVAGNISAATAYAGTEQ